MSSLSEYHIGKDMYQTGNNLEPLLFQTGISIRICSKLELSGNHKLYLKYDKNNYQGMVLNQNQDDYWNPLTILYSKHTLK